MMIGTSRLPLLCVGDAWRSLAIALAIGNGVRGGRRYGGLWVFFADGVQRIVEGGE